MTTTVFNIFQTLLLFCVSAICPCFSSSLILPHAPLSLPPSRRHPLVRDREPLLLSSWLRVSQAPGALHLGLLPPCPLFPSLPPYAPHPLHPPPHSLIHLSCPLPGSGSP